MIAHTITAMCDQYGWSGLDLGGIVTGENFRGHPGGGQDPIRSCTALAKQHYGKDEQSVSHSLLSQLGNLIRVMTWRAGHCPPLRIPLVRRRSRELCAVIRSAPYSACQFAIQSQ